jgi:hypothetical protein
VPTEYTWLVACIHPIKTFHECDPDRQSILFSVISTHQQRDLLLRNIQVTFIHSFIHLSDATCRELTKLDLDIYTVTPCTLKQQIIQRYLYKDVKRPEETETYKSMCEIYFIINPLALFQGNS